MKQIGGQAALDQLGDSKTLLMKASLEPLTNAYVLRVHPSGGYGDPYTWACTVEIDGDTATLKGVSRIPKISEARTIGPLLRSMGIARVTWERVNVALARTTSITARCLRNYDTNFDPG